MSMMDQHLDEDEVQQPHRETNTEFLTRVMEFSRSGALMQAFILHGLDAFARRVAALKPSECETTMVSGTAWHRCATELKAELEERFK